MSKSSVFARSLLIVLLLAAAGCSKSKSKGQGELSDQDLALQEQDRWADQGTIPKAQEGGLFKDVYFDFDSAAVREESYDELRKNVEMLRGDSTMRAEIEGHCDKRGTTEYNMALGERRAKAVATVMVSFGARAEQLSTVSYGEEVPLDPSDSEDAYAKNRRVHFAVYRRGEQQGAGKDRY